MEGQHLLPDLIEEVSHLSAQETDPIDDLRASRAYRREMVVNLLSRGLRVLSQTPPGEK
jgi:CO/xanthine dehydrogenase FAD-binding subunit